MIHTPQSMMNLLTHPSVQDMIVEPANKMGGGDPVNLDITFFIYLGIFLLTWFLLKTLLFEPYLKVRDARQSGIGGNKDEADAMRATAEGKMVTYKEALAIARAEAGETRDALKKEAVAEEERILGSARTEMTEKLEANRNQMNAQIEAAKGDLQTSAKGLSEMMVERLLPS
jgi:F0F1-type ATP synthase membrane subunit b/b'